MESMRPAEIIKKKRDGGELSKREIEYLLNGYLDNTIQDYQISAFLMSIFFRGLTMDETTYLTEIMLNSGKRLDLSDIEGIKIDKHSTGGVGDKVSIILAPLMASAGVIVPMISGRGLGHTGGTIDKLESTPNFRTSLTVEEFIKNLRDIGVSIISQTEDIAPLDKKLYALRDVTGTVESIPLIASSIMSKKLSEGINGLVLDVKCGSGAFMKNIESAVRLSQTMVSIGKAMSVKTIALITDMSQPLGRTVGNSLEIKEAISCLKGRWSEDLKIVTLNLGAWMLWIKDGIEGKRQKEIHEYIEYLNSLIDDGSAFEKFVNLIEAQGGDPEVAIRFNKLPSARHTVHILSDKSGYINSMDTEKIGIASMLLGAGRKKIGDPVDHSAGIVINKKIGDMVEKGEPLAIFHYNNDGEIEDAKRLYLESLVIDDKEPVRKDLIFDVIQ